MVVSGEYGMIECTGLRDSIGHIINSCMGVIMMLMRSIKLSK